MNRRHQTESAVFKLCRFVVFPKESPYQIIHKTGFLFLFMYLVPFQCRVHSPAETQREAVDMTETLMTVVKSNSKSTDLASFFGFGRLVLSSVLCREKTRVLLSSLSFFITNTYIIRITR